MGKFITIKPGDPPPSCQHYRIDNDTQQCRECGERMLSWERQAETVLSAPNAAGCSNPACRAALDAGTYDETNPPAGCTNPHGLYVPDRGRERTVVIGYDYTYKCERCSNDGTIISYGQEVVWDCGHSHRGDRVRAKV
jgi:DNA-directed RNA polymerase subunit RPC12/RpoP